MKKIKETQLQGEQARKDMASSRFKFCGNS